MTERIYATPTAESEAIDGLTGAADRAIEALAEVVEAIDKTSDRLYGKLSIIITLLEELVQASLPNPSDEMSVVRFTAGNLSKLLVGFHPDTQIHADGEGRVIGLVGTGENQKAGIKLLTVNP